MKDSKDKNQYGNYMLTALTIFIELLECMYLQLNVNSWGPILRLQDGRVIKFLQLVNMKYPDLKNCFSIQPDNANKIIVLLKSSRFLNNMEVGYCYINDILQAIRINIIRTLTYVVLKISEPE